MPQHRYAAYQILILLVGLLLSFHLFAAGISATDKYAWAENAGWQNFNSANNSASVQVYTDHLEGYVWAENIGWIRLGSYNGGGAHTYGNASPTDYGVNRAGASLSGYAWSETAGWINFAPTGGSTTIDATTGQFDGYAWSENVGWIHLRSATPTAYGVAVAAETALVVTNLDDSGTGSLRQVIADANTITGADTIAFQVGLTGLIILTTGEIAINDDVTIQGPVAGTLAIGGNNASRIFTVASGKTVNINRLTLQDGYTTTGGGAIENYGILDLVNIVLSGNEATDGGAIFNGTSATMTVTGSTISSNSATSTGGGIENYGTLDIINSSVSGNMAKYVGGISHHQSTTLNIINSTVANNSASGDSISSGGGIGNYTGTITIINSTVSGNSAIGDYSVGGGIDGGFGPVIITNSTITGNITTSPIGTINPNPEPSGGGIYTQNVLTIGNSLVASNTAPLANGKEIRIAGTGAIFNSQGNNLFGENGVWGITGGTQASTDLLPGGAISTVINTTLANNGGPTLTHLLAAGSPAINTGNNALFPNINTSTDQRGTGFPRLISDTVDIGAVEDATGLVMHIVTATAGPNGTIGLPPSQNVRDGATIAFTVTPDTGYSAIVTGCDTTLVSGTNYITGAIIADCTISATFSAQPALSINDVRQAKDSSGTTPFTFTVTLSSAASQPVTVAWATADGTALAGRDYTAASGSLSFAVGGALSQTLTVEVLGGAPSPDQTFFVRLSAPVNATLARIEGIGTILSLAPPAAAAGLVWTGDQFIAVSTGGQIHTSPDGFTWTAQNSGTTQNLNSVAGSGRQFVAVGSAGTILTSPDGIGWTPLTLAVTADLNGVAWSGSQFVAVGNGVILTSADGVTWTAQTAGNLYAVTWAGSQWVAVGAGGTILTSPDGFTWTAGSSGTAQDLRSVAWTGTQVVAVGSGGVILTSPNGNAWTARASGIPQDLSGIAWSGSQFLAGGTGGVLLASPDGIAWTPQAAGTPEDLYSIAWAGDRWLAVGANATRIALARTWGDLKPLILNRWTMLSLPGIPGTTTASTALAGLDPAAYLNEWSVYDYDLGSREYRQLPPTAPLSQTSGYWIIDQGSVAHTVQLTTPATATPVGFSAGCPSTRGCYEIPLRAPSGTDAHLFHLVGMPFPYPVGWWEVRLEVDGTAIPLDDARNVYVAPGYWVWNGNDYDTYDSATPGSVGLLQPWQGIWVKVLAAGQGHTLKLLIPRLPKYSHVPTPARPIPGWQKALDWLIPAAAAAESERRWYVRLIAEEATTPMRTRNSVLGQLPDSVEGYDAHDLPKMAPFAAPYLSIAFPQPAWGTRADDYATDYRPSRAARLPPATWRFEVRTDRAGYAVTLRWEGPPDLLGRMELVDEDTGRRYPASDPGVLRNGVPLTMTAPVRHFTWIFAGQPAP